MCDIIFVHEVPLIVDRSDVKNIILVSHYQQTAVNNVSVVFHSVVVNYHQKRRRAYAGRWQQCVAMALA